MGPIPSVIKLGFDPAKATGDLKKVFDDHIARTFWLAWRCSHITTSNFDQECLAIADDLRGLEIITESALVAAMTHRSFLEGDIESWVPRALMYFRDDEIRYVVADNVYPCKCHGWCDVNTHHRFLTGHHENCPNSPDPTRKAIDLIVELGQGMAKWAADAEGVHIEAWDAYRRARMFEGVFLPEDPFEPEEESTEEMFSVLPDRPSSSYIPSSLEIPPPDDVDDADS